MHFLGRYSPPKVRFQLIKILQPFHILFLDFEKKIQNKTPRTMFLKKTGKKIKTKNKTPRTMFLKKTGTKMRTIRDKDQKLHAVWGQQKKIIK